MSIRLWTLTRISEGYHLSELTSAKGRISYLDSQLDPGGDTSTSEVIANSDGVGVIREQTEKLMRKSREALDAMHLRSRLQDSLIIFVASYS